MTAHTAATLSALSGVELSEACARAMGWECLGSYIGYSKWLNGENLRYILAEGFGDHRLQRDDNFRPDLDTRHAAEFRAWVCALRPDTVFEVVGPFSPDGHFLVRICGPNVGLVRDVTVEDTEPRAITICGILAAQALAGDGA